MLYLHLNGDEHAVDTAPDAPLYLVDTDAAQGGIGEPGVLPAAPAVRNATFAAMGKRIRPLLLLKT